MPKPGQESGTVEKSVDWAEALTETLSKSQPEKVEGHLTKRTQELSETQKRYQKLDDVLKPYETVAKQSGVDIAPHIAEAMQYYMAFRRDPVSTVKALIQANKLTPEAL